VAKRKRKRGRREWGEGRLAGWGQGEMTRGAGGQVAQPPSQSWVWVWYRSQASSHHPPLSAHLRPSKPAEGGV